MPTYQTPALAQQHQARLHTNAAQHRQAKLARQATIETPAAAPSVRRVPQLTWLRRTHRATV